MNENKSTFIVVETPATKVTVTISRQQLWENFVESWSEIAWDNYIGTSLLNEVAEILCNRESLQISENRRKIKKLFRDGNTAFMMGDAMEKFDMERSCNMLREIIVTDTVNDLVHESIIISHADINF